MENWTDCFLLLSEELLANELLSQNQVKTSKTQMVGEFKKK